MPANPQLSPSHAQVVAVKAALRFVYPGIEFDPHLQITPELAAYAFLLARALDSTSRVTYGLFKFYEGLLAGMVARSLSWSDIPDAITEAVKGAVEDKSPQRNALVQNFLQMWHPMRNVVWHMRDPESFPLPELRIDKNNALDRLIYRLGD